jgi:hypothetical protein
MKVDTEGEFIQKTSLVTYHHNLLQMVVLTYDEDTNVVTALA